MPDPGPPSLAARLVVGTLAFFTLVAGAICLTAAAWMALWVGAPLWVVGIGVVAALAGAGALVQRVRRSAP